MQIIAATQAAFHVGPGWAPVGPQLGPSWAPVGPDCGPFGNAAWVESSIQENDGLILHNI